MSTILKKDSLNSILRDFQRGERESSIKKLKEYNHKYPEDINAIYNLGVMYQEVYQYENSINQYLKVIKKNKTHWQSYANLGLIYFLKREYLKSNQSNVFRQNG